MTLIICPGMHDVGLTDCFVRALMQQKSDLPNVLIVPTQRCPPFSGPHLLQFLIQEVGVPDRTHHRTVLDLNADRPLHFISFSAGVVGTIAAAWMWQRLGGRIGAMLAIDGWGMPLVGDFPIDRVSHDYFTHWSSPVLGDDRGCFYADPAVEHLYLWQFPERVWGWGKGDDREGNREVWQRMTAIEFIGNWVRASVAGKEPLSH